MIKQSLIKALTLFSFIEQISLIISLLINKFVFFNKKSCNNHLWLEFINYSKLLDRGILLKKLSSKDLLLETYVLDKSIKLIIRRNTSDLNVFKTIILDGEYEIAAKYISQQLDKNLLLIDAGANIGATSIYLMSLYPSIKTVAIEPDKENFSYLQKNISYNNLDKKTKLLNAALWISKAKLKITSSFRDGLPWSLAVEETSNIDEGNVIGLSLKDIINQNNIKSNILLKIDIEGSERFLFKNKEFISMISSNINALIIEIHDEFNTREHINESMKKLGFYLTETESLSFYVKQ